MIKENTFLGMELFRDEFMDTLIFHIPHSKTKIPQQFRSDFVDVELTNGEINLLTDFATDEIFDIDGTSKLVFPYSRVFCDVERLSDEHEVMFKHGRGFYYTKTDSGETLRTDNFGNKEVIHRDYYKKHHEALSKMVGDKIKEHGFATIIDCHSFSDTPFDTDLDKRSNRPDFCIGTDSFHTPKWLVDMIKIHLTNHGYSVGIDHPYSGTIVPLESYGKCDDINSVMIEVNRKLYMDGDVVLVDKVRGLNELISGIFTP